MRLFRLRTAAIFLPLALAAIPAMAQEVSAPATLADDTTVYENEPGDNAGAYDAFCVGNLMTEFMTRRGLIRYDLPDIPDGATVRRVTLDVRQVQVRRQGDGAPKAATVEVHRVTGGWSEGTLSGTNSGPCSDGNTGVGVTWDTQPDAQATPSASHAVSGSSNVAFTFDSDQADDAGLVADVQAWVDGAANQGWLVRLADEADPNTARRLEAGELVVTWEVEDTPAFSINPGLNDAWFNPDTSGQGFFFNVFPDAGVFFMAWFTYDTERPPEDITAIIGEPGHRWITAQGPFEGDTAVLDATLSTGGLFDDPTDVTNSEYGSVTVTFTGCNSGEVAYNFPGPGVSGTVPIRRVVQDNIALCEALQEQPENR